MIAAPWTSNEAKRLAALHAFDILDSDPEQAFDDLARVAARICGTPIALVSLVDEDRQWFKARVGLDVPETERSLAFCSHAILEPEKLMVVEDATADARFLDNPLVTGDPHVTFYAGAPLVTQEGYALGTLCVIDHEPRELSDDDRETLWCLARAAVSHLEVRKAALDLRDVSEALMSTNEELEARNGEIRRFYQTLSHELKTPVTVARDYVSMVIEGLAGEVNEQQTQFLTVGLNSCDRIAAHVDDLLDLTRIETGKLRLNVTTLSPCEMVGTVVTELGPQAQRAGVALSRSPCAALPAVAADGERVRQVLSNLIRNAIKFTAVGGACEVGARVPAESPEFVEIWVQDTGCGIPRWDLGRVFERLYQCRDDDAGAQHGLGIGLHLCREIVLLHGGEIAVESTEGVGTTVRFLLPVEHASHPDSGPRTLQEATT